MAEADALSKFDFGQVGGSSLFLKFKAGEPVTLRVLTVDPVVSIEEYRNQQTDEVESVSTKFSFVVYNFTAGKAQILKCTPTVARKIGELHTDPDFGANIRKVDIKITPTGEKLERRYDVQVLPKTNELTPAMIKEAQAIKLDDRVEGDRMSIYKPPTIELEGDGYQHARNMANIIKGAEPDTVIEDIGDEPINLDAIPF